MKLAAQLRDSNETTALSVEDLGIVSNPTTAQNAGRLAVQLHGSNETTALSVEDRQQNPLVFPLVVRQKKEPWIEQSLGSIGQVNPDNLIQKIKHQVDLENELPLFVHKRKSPWITVVELIPGVNLRMKRIESKNRFPHA